MAMITKYMKKEIKKSYFYKQYNYLRALKEKRMWSFRDQQMKEFYSFFLTPGDLCFDVGANIGNRTKIFLSLGVKVIAFEPQEDCVKVLKKLYGKNQKLIIIDKALGQMEGEADFFIADGNTISSFSSDWISAVKRSGRFSENSWTAPRSVKMTTLDKMIEMFGIPEFIKIDVEGFESQVLEGLSQPINYLSIEYTPEYRENTEKCMIHLSSLGRFKTNFSIGESLKFTFQDWVSWDELNKYLEKYSGNASIWGDIYFKYY